jgi:UDP-3-O-[3-hydroxymyristoyl] glucosamine N-acyltransferase
MLEKIKNIFGKNNNEQRIVYNQFFTKRLEYMRLEEIVFLTKTQPPMEYDFEKRLENVTTLANATETDISFLTNKKYIEDLEETEAGVVFVPADMVSRVPSGTIPLVSDNPHYSYTQCLNALYSVPIFEKKCGISRKANISWSAKIGKNVEIQAGVFIGERVVIGDGCKICANAVIHHDCIIGDDTYIGSNATISYTNVGRECVIHNNACIGQDGFGFAHDKMFNHKVPQMGRVIVSEYVEIGASTCIDRGALDDTVIGTNSKLDNQLQIAHGVKIGAGCFLAACTGIAGSAQIGNFVQIGGHSAIAGHISIADGVQIAAHSGVAKSIEEPMTQWGGAPAMPAIKWHRLHFMMEKMLDKKGEKNEK